MKTIKKTNVILLILLVVFLFCILLWQTSTNKTNNDIETENDGYVTSVEEETNAVKENEGTKRILSKEDFDAFLNDYDYSTVEFNEEFNKKYFNATDYYTFEDVLVKQKGNNRYYYFTYFSVASAKEVFKTLSEDNSLLEKDANFDNYNYWNVEKEISGENLNIVLVDNVILVYIGEPAEYFENFLVVKSE